jgi:hypothetical protein
MRLVGGLHWVEDPDTASFLGSTTTIPTTRQDIIVGVSFFLFLFRNLFLSVCGLNPLFFINLSSPFAVVERLPEHHSNDRLFLPPTRCPYGGQVPLKLPWPHNEVCLNNAFITKLRPSRNCDTVIL